MNKITKIAQNIKLAMEIADIKETELAKAIFVSQSTINQILNGVTKFPRIDILQLIAKKLGVTIDQLVDEETLSIRDSETMKHHFAPIIEWDEILSFSNDENYDCLDKKKLVINVADEEVNARRFALKTTPSMEPQFRRDTYIIVEPTQVYKDHQIAVVSHDGHEPVLRRIIKDGADIYVQKLNPGPSDINEKVTNLDAILGKVICEIRFEEDFN